MPAMQVLMNTARLRSPTGELRRGEKGGDHFYDICQKTKRRIRRKAYFKVQEESNFFRSAIGVPRP